MTRTGHLPPEEQFALLLDGELRADEVDDELASLLALTEAVDEHVIAPRAEFGFRAQLRGELVAATEGQTASVWERVRHAVWMRTAQLRNSARTALASGVAASMIGTAGVAAASQHALPGELLYPVKELTESVRLALAGDLAATGRLQLRFAEERLEEVQEGAGTLRPGLLIDTLEEMDEASISGAEDLLGWATRTGDETVLDELADFTVEQREGLEELLPRLPSAVVPFAEDSLEVLRRIDLELAGEPQPCDCPEPASDDGAPAISAPGEAPAGSVQRPCDCTPATDAPPTTREDPTTDAPDADPSTDDPSEPDTPSDGEAPSGDEDVDLVPELPGPLDDAGDAIDDAVNDAIDDITDPLDDTVDDVTDPLDDTVDDVTDPLDDTVDDVTDPLDDTVDDTLDGTTDDTLDGTLDEVSPSPSPLPSPSL